MCAAWSTSNRRDAPLKSMSAWDAPPVPPLRPDHKADHFRRDERLSAGLQLRSLPSGSTGPGTSSGKSTAFEVMRWLDELGYLEAAAEKSRAIEAEVAPPV